MDIYIIILTENHNSKTIVLRKVIDEQEAKSIIEEKKTSLFKSLLKKPKKDELYVSGLSVPQEKRGQGIGTILIKNKIAFAKTNGYNIFSLDVATNNIKAEKLYSKLGFIIKEEKIFSGKRNGFIIPNLRKMELPLNL